ncbi:MAG TPA: hypothetical protein VH933_02450 [Aestuariivirgaceae bacterium]|jgi:hypothetical protein
MQTSISKLSALAALALFAMGSAGLAATAQYHKPMTQTCVDQKDCPANAPQTKAQTAAWKFDPAKQERSRHKSDHFRFRFGDYWYPARYWMGYGLSLSHRIACSDGRAILRDHGYYRVRPIECRGGAFTYLGHRHGDSFRVLLSSRTGRIVSVKQV